MIEAAVWGLIAASSLVIGSLLTFWLRPSRKLIGLIMAFGAGTLISAIAYELVEKAAASGRTLTLAAGLALGAVTFSSGIGGSIGPGERTENDRAASRPKGIHSVFVSARCWTASPNRLSWARRW